MMYTISHKRYVVMVQLQVNLDTTTKYSILTLRPSADSVTEAFQIFAMKTSAA